MGMTDTFSSNEGFHSERRTLVPLGLSHIRGTPLALLVRADRGVVIDLGQGHMSPILISAVGGNRWRWWRAPGPAKKKTIYAYRRELSLPPIQTATHHLVICARVSVVQKPHEPVQGKAIHDHTANDSEHRYDLPWLLTAPVATTLASSLPFRLGCAASFISNCCPFSLAG